MKNTVRLLAVLCFAWPLISQSQTKYLAAYEQKAVIDFSAVKVDISPRLNLGGLDSVFSAVEDSVHSTGKDSILALLNSRDLIAQLLKKLGEEMSMYAHVRADSVNAELEYTSSRNGVNVSTKQKYENGSWRSFNPKTKAYEPDTLRYAQEFILTGASRQMFGYTCREAQSKAGAKITVWVCNELPPTISPGFTISSIHGAVFELIDDDKKTRIVLRSLRKLQN